MAPEQAVAHEQGQVQARVSVQSLNEGQGMFGWLHKDRPRTIRSYEVWQSESAKLAGICRAVANDAESPAVVLIAHFWKTADALGRQLDALGIAWRPLNGSPLVDQIPAKRGDRAEVFLLHSDILAPQRDQLEQRRRSAHEPGGDHGRTELIVADVHPLPDRDELVQAFADALSFETDVQHHVSLQDPLLRLFVNDSTVELLAKLGADEHEPIHHGLVDGAIARALQRVTQSVVSDRPAESVEEWLRLNHRPKSTAGR